jgi:long-subunit fatty acid transport protein
VCAVAVRVSLAQTNTENFAQFKFNFNNPGARATGIGGAFVSIADDATAAEANPAGLTNVIRPELSVETKGIRFKTDVNNFSHTGTEDNYTINSRQFSNSLVSPSFASIVMPVRRLTFSAFRYELVNFQSDFFTEGSYVSPLKDGSFFFPVRSHTNLRVVNWGGAAAFRFNELFSVGASFGLSVVSMESSLKRYFLEVFDESALANVTSIDDSNNDLFFNVGILVHPLENLSLGAIFKRRPAFSLQQTYRFTDYPNDSSSAKSINLKIPSSIGVGISYRPTDVLTLAVDAEYITYSRLTEDFVLTASASSLNTGDFTVDDGVEYHAGAEYVLLLRNIGIVFRGGVYVEPDTRIRFTGNINDSNDPDRIFTRQVFATLFQPGESNVHYTFGGGLIFSDNFQFDVAGNLSTGSDEVVGSFVVRF